MPTVKDLPSFEEVEKGLPSTFWGPKGSYEEGRGMLNLLTPQVIQRARDEIVEGRSIGLNWHMGFLDHASFGRLTCQHKIVKIPAYPNCLDDEYSLNPQASSQWDGFRHWSDTFTGKMYGGQTLEEASNPKDHHMGIGNWAKEGIVGRGVLLDYVAYAKKHGIKYEAFSPHAVSVSVLKDIAKEENVQFLPGDLLLIRFGYTATWESFDQAKRIHASESSTQSVGLEQSEEMCRFLWGNHFSAVIGDNIGLEVVPFLNLDWCIHNHLLPRWGVPIGELWALDNLADACAKTGKYTFLLASAPFNQPAGISSVPNAVAVI